MPKKLTALDIKILQALCLYGPRNLSEISRKIHVAREKVGFRVKRMQINPQFFLRMHTCVYHTNLGLRKAVVLTEANPGKEQLLFDCLLVNPFWLHACRSYGMGEGCTGIYAVPIDHCNEFEEFIHELRRLDVAKNAEIHWSTCFQGGRITSEWFDPDEKKWTFHWDDWMKEVQTETVPLPYTLKEPKYYYNHADQLDIKMLEKLEADATRSLSEVARNLGISRQLARFHFERHLMKKNLIEGYEVFVMRYGDAPYVMALFIISFPDYARFAKFAGSFLDKFFVLTMGKILGEDALLAEVFLPTEEFRKFVENLSVMAQMGLVQSYKYLIQDLRMRRRQTISPPLFRNNAWFYDHKEHLERLQQKATKPPTLS
jgi:DNA-binding Lrp family transcriptional regulator